MARWVFIYLQMELGIHINHQPYNRDAVYKWILILYVIFLKSFWWKIAHWQKRVRHFVFPAPTSLLEFYWNVLMMVVLNAPFRAVILSSTCWLSLSCVTGIFVNNLMNKIWWMFPEDSDVRFTEAFVKYICQSQNWQGNGPEKRRCKYSGAVSTCSGSEWGSKLIKSEQYLTVIRRRTAPEGMVWGMEIEVTWCIDEVVVYPPRKRWISNTTSKLCKSTWLTCSQ